MEHHSRSQNLTVLHRGFSEVGFIPDYSSLKPNESQFLQIHFQGKVMKNFPLAKKL
jgi:hypothetical protein